MVLVKRGKFAIVGNPTGISYRNKLHTQGSKKRIQYLIDFHLKLHTTVKNSHNSDTFISIIVTLICIKLINELPHINSNLALFYLSHILFIRLVHTIRRLLKCLIVKIYLKLMLIDFLSVSFLSSYHRDRSKKEKKFSFIKTATKAISDHFLWLSHGASYDFKNKMIK